MSKQLFVTGATGYIGPALIEAAVSNGYTVRGLSRSEAGDTKVIKAGGTPVRGKTPLSETPYKETSRHMFSMAKPKCRGSYIARCPP